MKRLALALLLLCAACDLRGCLSADCRIDCIRHGGRYDDCDESCRRLFP